MTVALATSLVECGRVDAEHVSAKYAELYEPWRGYGGAAHRVMRALRRGADYRGTGQLQFPAGTTISRTGSTDAMRSLGWHVGWRQLHVHNPDKRQRTLPGTLVKFIRYTYNLVMTITDHQRETLIGLATGDALGATGSWNCEKAKGSTT